MEEKSNEIKMEIIDTINNNDLVKTKITRKKKKNIEEEESSFDNKKDKKTKKKEVDPKSLNNDLCFTMKKMNLEENDIKLNEKKMIVNIFPVNGPELVCLDVDRLLTLYYIKDHKYIGLQTIEDETHPVFFILLSSDWNENNEIPCQFFKHKTSIDNSGMYHSIPEWDKEWKIGMLHKKFIYNCIPFDESRDYFYSPV
jgi:hypothetical protein